MILDTIPGIVFTLGDNTYPRGAPEEFEQCYEPTWGRHKARTRPATGNHDYKTAGAAGYFGYFGDAARGEGGKGYYSYEHGAWHVVVLDSSEPPREGWFSEQQLNWLRQDLSRSNARCTIAYWHHPRFTSGLWHNDGAETAKIQPAWDVLYAYGVDVVLVGHEHNYERFAPQTPTGEADPVWGIRQFVVGSGGESNYPLDTLGTAPNSEVFHTRAPGVLKLELHPDRYDWQFISLPGRNFSDSGSGVCHDAPLKGSASGNWWWSDRWAAK
jgi:hypothetical protein